MLSLVSYVCKNELKLLFTCVTEKDPANVMCYAYGYNIDGCNVYMMFEIIRNWGKMCTIEFTAVKYRQNSMEFQRRHGTNRIGLGELFNT